MPRDAASAGTTESWPAPGETVPQNVALVSVIATVPSTGVRDGDHLDCHVMSMGAASSLKGGRLFVCPMQGPLPSRNGGFYAMAEGPVTTGPW